jgi:hypothetical protein
MTSDAPPPKAKPGPGKLACGQPAADRQAEREAKLAQALRANLRRRKVEPKPKPANPGGDDSA